jgi:hypothetical protein
VLIVLASLVLIVLPLRTKSALVAHRSAAGKHPRGPVVLSLASMTSGPEFAPGAVGLSVEADELTTQDLNVNDKPLLALMRHLGPGTLRLGGNSLDYSWWTSDGEQPPAWAKSVVSPGDLSRLRQLLVATGWRAILGVDFGHFDPSRAADEAQVAQSILGSRLLGFEIGNEPDSYGDESIKLRPARYDPASYLVQVSTYRSAMSAVAPTLRLYGPDLSAPSWLATIASSKSMPFAVITQHYYPTSYSLTSARCKATPVPTAAELLSPQVREQENTVLETIVRAGDVAHRGTLISETNDTSSCDTYGGPATSPVFASALWSFDWTLRSASAGVGGLDFHGYFGRCRPASFGPICAPGRIAEARGQVMARPEFYGIFAASQLENGRFFPVRVTGRHLSDDFSTYATEHSGGAVTLAIDNFSASHAIPFVLKTTRYREATIEALTAPSVNSTEEVTLGGSSFGATGTLHPKGTVLPKYAGAFHFVLAPASAAVLTLAI